LKTMKGQPLPQVAWESDTFTSFLVGDTLVFQANGTGEERVSYRFEPRGGSQLEENGQHEVNAFTYTISGNDIAISLECSGLALCAPPPHYTGIIDDGRIALQMTMTESSMRVFERQ
ncbi:MAG TPA: hypothetical protein VFO55_06140, partial [Gemmatimonadaceae bacterium]|nr:hypothetical protein [Gemmatimonadaceae bacterium]